MNASAMIFVPARPAPNRRHYGMLALLFAAFAVYGSVTPLHLHRLPFAEAVARFDLVLAQPITVQSRSDWLANFLLLLPLGFSLMGTLCCDRPQWTVPAIPMALSACVVLAIFVEFAQLYFPPRVSSINDIAAQSLGAATGTLFWLLRGQRLTSIARRLWSDIGSQSTIPLLLVLYLIVLLIVQTLPFDFTLSPVELYHKYKAGRVHLLPLFASGTGGFALANKLFWNAALFAPVGLLLAHFPGRISRNGALVFALGLSISAGIELAQLLAISRYFVATDIIIGGVVVLAGWFVARRYASSAAPPRLRGVLLALCLATLIFMEWQPFDFSPSAREASARLHRVSLLPFVDYLQGNYLNALDDGIHKILLFVPLGMLLAPSAQTSQRAIVFRWSLAIAVVIVLEAGQLFLSTRYASATDVLLGAVAAGMGMFLVCHARNAGSFGIQERVRLSRVGDGPEEEPL